MDKKRSHVHSVSHDRWLEAQKWELELWKRQDEPHTPKGKILALMQKVLRKKWQEDWNLWWRGKFDNYDFVPNSLETALELGCGPYTNMRLILKNREIKRVFCSDPLAQEYIKFNRGWLAWAYKEGVVQIDNHPAEKTQFQSNFADLVIMINVLDHVRDVVACINEAVRVTKRGGQLVIGQDLTGDEDFVRWPDLEDTGHPISIHHSTLDDLLLPNFEVIMRKVLPRYEGRNPPYHYGTYLFVGKKLKDSLNDE